MDRLLCVSWIALALLMSWPSSAASQELPATPAATAAQPPTDKEDVKVTAEKWEADPQRVPLSLTVIDPAVAGVSGALLLNQVGPYVPGLFLRVDGDRSFNKPSLRGITSSPFNDSAVGIYIDDVPVDPRMGLATPLVDVERIEVIRGPQGVIWGRNTSGGVMHVVTRLPGNTWQTQGGLSVGTFGEVAAPFSIHGPIAQDKVFLGVSGLFDHRAGYLTNSAKADVRDSRAGGFARATLRWIPTSSWDVQVRSDSGLWA
jgi:iron complex outermembrane receptor protein